MGTTLIDVAPKDNTTAKDSTTTKDSISTLHSIATMYSTTVNNMRLNATPATSSKSKCRKELQELNAGIKIMKALASHRVPEELILLIFNATIRLRRPLLRLFHRGDGTKTARALLGGLSDKDTRELWYFVCESLFQTSRVRIKISYDMCLSDESGRITDSNTIATLPSWFLDLDNTVRHLRLHYTTKTDNLKQIAEPEEFHNRIEVWPTFESRLLVSPASRSAF